MLSLELSTYRDRMVHLIIEITFCRFEMEQTASHHLTSHLEGEGKLFAPGNLRATFDNPAYERLINYYLGEKYTLRYTGGMVPDVGVGRTMEGEMVSRLWQIVPSVSDPSHRCSRFWSRRRASSLTSPLPPPRLSSESCLRLPLLRSW